MVLGQHPPGSTMLMKMGDCGRLKDHVPFCLKYLYIPRNGVLKIQGVTDYRVVVLFGSLGLILIYIRAQFSFPTNGAGKWYLGTREQWLTLTKHHSPGGEPVVIHSYFLIVEVSSLFAAKYRPRAYDGMDLSSSVRDPKASVYKGLLWLLWCDFFWCSSKWR